MIKENRWTLLDPPETLTSTLSQSLDIHPLLAKLLLNRQVPSLPAAKRFLGQEEAVSGQDFEVSELTRMAALLRQCIEKKEGILVYGDYDVDGITSTSIMVSFLRQAGALVEYFIPHRFEHGYGLSAHVIDLVKHRGFSLLMTLDCGTSDGPIISELKQETGCRVMVLDHHQLPEILPDCDGFLNPMSLEDGHYYKTLCTVGIVYRFVQFCQEAWQIDVDLSQFLDLVALGTVADIASLTGANRDWVRLGLNQLSTRRNRGIKALLEGAGCEKASISVRDCGFVIAPRLNSAGRLNSATISVRLLLSESDEEARCYALQLEQLNQARRQMDQLIFKESVACVEKESCESNIIVLSGRTWHAGVVGITAAKLVQHFHKPVVVIAEDDTVGRGSARTVGSVNIYDVLKTCKSYFDSFGGHKEAAGFKMKVEQIAPFSAFLKQASFDLVDRSQCRPVLTLDSKLDPDMLSLQTLSLLDKLEPFGKGNDRPLFFSDSLRLLSCQCVGNGTHVKGRFSDQSGQLVIDGIGFNLSEKLALFYQPQFTLAFHLSVNEWQGRCLPQLEIVDIK